MLQNSPRAAIGRRGGIDTVRVQFDQPPLQFGLCFMKTANQYRSGHRRNLAAGRSVQTLRTCDLMIDANRKIDTHDPALHEGAPGRHEEMGYRVASRDQGSAN